MKTNTKTLVDHLPDDHDLPRSEHRLLHNDQDHPTHGLLHHLLGAAAQNLACLADLPRKIGPQTQAHRSTAFTVVVPNSTRHDNLLGHLDNQVGAVLLKSSFEEFRFKISFGTFEPLSQKENKLFFQFKINIEITSTTLRSDPPKEVYILDWNKLKFSICEYNWFDHSLAIGELLFLLWGIKVVWRGLQLVAITFRT